MKIIVGLTGLLKCGKKSKYVSMLTDIHKFTEMTIDEPLNSNLRKLNTWTPQMIKRVLKSDASRIVVSDIRFDDEASELLKLASPEITVIIFKIVSLEYSGISSKYVTKSIFNPIEMNQSIFPLINDTNGTDGMIE